MIGFACCFKNICHVFLFYSLLESVVLCIGLDFPDVFEIFVMYVLFISSWRMCCCV